ncbi:Choline transporter-like protein ctl1 [Pleurostoma richardsiae]|uniref:Protein PNS1 n=1 Tax=Pleurostoma richardsiae TaxID=41990 RepID=A0AA38RCT7_9PEZI|nr:Choline transporter-like protein ctl1 [Pleurostoma richardsiae]
MFSEYASRFLAQSQSRLSNLGQPDANENGGRQPGDWQSRGYRNGGRSFLGRGAGPGIGNPYQPAGSRFGHLNFASRYSTAQDAPLFHSIRDDLREEDDEEERDREAADLYALQRSRRVVAASRLEESTEPEDEGSKASLDQSEEQDGSTNFAEAGRGIQSSWRGPRSTKRRDLDDEPYRDAEDRSDRKESQSSEDGKGKMVDIGLESTIADSEPPADLTMETPVDDAPPPFQQFRDNAAGPSRFPLRRDSAALESELAQTEADTMPSAPPISDGEMFQHDPFFAYIYLIAMASMFATFVLVWLHTSPPSGTPWGDTIYTTLHASFHLLAVDTLVSIIVSLVWLAALRSFVRPLVALIVVAVPVILFSFSLYPMISSYKGPKHGATFQDSIMRWAAVIPGVCAIVWVWLVWHGRYALRSAIEILEFASRILAANSALILVGMACLSLIVLWTWTWLGMFTRVFLGGYFSKSISRFIISASSWWLGIYFVLMYIWTLSIISGVQRGTTAATVSQWYFHRNAVPSPSSREVVAAALGHSATTIFGSISLSTLLALVIRLPLLILPSRLANIVGVFFYSFIPTPITALTNPLTLTYAAIHSQSLVVSARGLSQMDFLTPQAPTTTLTPRAFNSRRGTSTPLLPYRLAKLLLHATRFIMATALGFAGWVMTARQLRISLPDGGVRGSAYAYVVGLVASFIGWGVLGAMEGILSGIVDAVVICYGSETRMASGGGGYCMEAAYLFGDRRDERRREALY